MHAIAGRPEPSIGALLFRGLVAGALLLGACGEAQPAVVEAGPEDFDRQKFVDTVVNNPPDSMRMSLEMAAPAELGAGTIKSETSMRAKPEAASHEVMDFEIGGAKLRLETITIGDQRYMRGEGGGAKVDWMTAKMPDGEGEPGFGDLGGGAEQFAKQLDKAWTAAAVADCRGRTCFVLTEPGDPQFKLYVDTGTYLPVIIEAQIEEGTESTQINIDWNAEVQISPPSGAKAVSPEELGRAFQPLLMSLPTTGG